MSGHKTVPTTDKNQALLSAIAELREAVGRLIDEQTDLALGRSAEPPAGALAPEPAPAVVPTPPPPTSAPVAVAPAATYPTPPPAPAVTPPARPTAPTPRARVREAPPAAAAPEPAEPPAPAPEPSAAGRPEDSRQRLDALAKLLDRRLKPTAHTPGETPARSPDA